MRLVLSRASALPLLLLFGLILVTVAAASADEVILEPSKDNTLYFDPDGDLSNGAGEYLFTGRGNNFKRAMLAFDIGAAVPAGSTIDSVELTLHMSRSIVPGITNTLHRVLRDWGEGASDAPGQEGAGGVAESGDATWAHTFWNTELWNSPGGDVVGSPSASQLIGDVDDYVFSSTPEMVADVQSWLDQPESNAGWQVRGLESFLLRSAKRFDSREHPDPDRRPRLRVVFTPSLLDIPALGLLGTMILAATVLISGLWILCRLQGRRRALNSR